MPNNLLLQQIIALVAKAMMEFARPSIVMAAPAQIPGEAHIDRLYAPSCRV